MTAFWKWKTMNWNVFFRTMSLVGFRERWRQTVDDSPQFPRSRINVLLFFWSRKELYPSSFRSTLIKKSVLLFPDLVLVHLDERHLDEGFKVKLSLNVIRSGLFKVHKGFLKWHASWQNQRAWQTSDRKMGKSWLKFLWCGIVSLTWKIEWRKSCGKLLCECGCWNQYCFLCFANY